VPVVGVRTITELRKAGAAVLSVDAGRTLLLDGADVIEVANEAEIAVVGRALTSQDARK